ncbi:helix-turn-helix domain-containing protein [Marinobacterium arenosum]|uniref:helix-turn-helix domain-containing protein n=1 Tax=Marinobacterium arenosum TaxID=2862496 RepID=UPI001C97FCD6|nr:AraC family transcriptional regulator [Marinobacterium arenosum]MBY4675224.1 helix-turn-helix domain-containing protein [Marinobacterium arenosum]
MPIEVGHEFFERMEPHPHASHTEHVLTLLVRGRLRMEHGGLVEIGPGAVTLVPAGVPHRLLEGEGMEVWWLAFCASCVELDESHPLMSSFRQVRLGALPMFQLPPERLPYCVKLMQELQAEAAQSTPESFEVMRSLLLLLLREAKRAAPLDVSGGGEQSLVSDALAFIQQHSLEPISLRDVAEAVHRSPSYLASVVKNKTGYSVGEWISRSRLSEACSRLAHTDEPVDRIASRVGWNDVTHFIRQFKKAYGITPAAWRKENRMHGG